MIVTINTDASFTWSTKQGAYAFNICSNEFRLEKSGRFHKAVSSAPQAESYAILNATTYFIRHVWPYYKVTELIYYSDSLICINAMNKPICKYKGPPVKMSHIFKIQMESIFEGNKVNIKRNYRWVKGHQKETLDIPSRENKWCDSMATNAMSDKFVCCLYYSLKKHQILNFKGTVIKV